MKEKFIMSVFQKHIAEITQWVREDVALCSDDFKKNENPLEYLPEDIVLQLQNSTAFEKAFKVGLITFDGNYLVSHFKSNRQLTYFCGRCFCNDTVVGRKLFKGEFNYPTSDLERIFRVSNMHDARKKLRRDGISERYKPIDSLFDK